MHWLVHVTETQPRMEEIMLPARKRVYSAITVRKQVVMDHTKGHEPPSVR
jgi:hypothetical protein